MLATLTLRAESVNSDARFESGATMTAWPSQTVGSVSAPPDADSSPRRPASLAEARGLGCGHHPPAVHRDRVQPASALQALRIDGGHRRGRRTGGFRRARRHPLARRAAVPRRTPGGVGPGRPRVQQLRHRATRRCTTRCSPAPRDCASRSEDTPAPVVGGVRRTACGSRPVSPAAGTSDTLTEVLWAALHGLTTLDRSGRLRPEYRAARVDLLVSALSPPT